MLSVGPKLCEWDRGFEKGTGGVKSTGMIECPLFRGTGKIRSEGSVASRWRTPTSDPDVRRQLR